MKLTLKAASWAEKRSSERIDLDCPAEVRVRRPFHFLLKRAYRAYTPSVMAKPSFGGMQLHVSDGVELGDRLDIRLHLKQVGYRRNCKVRGQVCWVQPELRRGGKLIGVYLLEQSPERESWKRFLTEKLRYQHAQLSAAR